MTSVGEQLRRERTRQGIDLAELARSTRISLKYLEAIESGDRTNLPGGFFYRSFVRQYATALVMDPAVLDAELDQAREAEAALLNAALEKASFPLKTQDPIVVEGNRSLASGRIGAYVLMLAGVLAGCTAFYSWWHRIENPVEQARSAPPTAALVQNAAQVQNASLAKTPPAGSPQVTLNAVTTSDDRVVLSLAATEEVWLSINSDGKTIFSGILEPSETKVLGGKERAVIRVSNAGGIDITWNGKTIGPIGPHGQVRSVLFTPENYRILPVGNPL